MTTQKLVTALVALAATIVLTAAPAYANGISVHKAGQQFKADMEACTPAWKHSESQYTAWEKHHQHGHTKAVNAMFATVLGPTIRLGHEMRSQQWPSQYLGAIEAFAADTTTLRSDFQQIIAGNPPSSFDNDLDTWGSDGQTVQTVQSDLHVALPGL